MFDNLLRLLFAPAEERIPSAPAAGVFLGAVIGVTACISASQAVLLHALSFAGWIVVQVSAALLAVVGASLMGQSDVPEQVPAGGAYLPRGEPRPGPGCLSYLMLVAGVIVLIGAAISLLLAAVVPADMRWPALYAATLFASVGVGGLYQRARPSEFVSFSQTIQFWAAILTVPQTILFAAREVLQSGAFNELFSRGAPQ